MIDNNRKTKFSRGILIILIVFCLVSSMFPLRNMEINISNVDGDDGSDLLTPTGDPWWDSSWSYNKKIIIDHTKVGDDLINFPILFDNTSVDFLHAQSDGDDFVFMDEMNSTQYNHEIERFNLSGDNRLIAWVNVSKVWAANDTILYLYYGNSGASNQEDITGTWNSNYHAVWHLNESTPENCKDSTSNNYDLASKGGDPSVDTGGVAGNCTYFDGNDYLKCPNLGIIFNSDFMVEMWIKPDDGQPAATDYFYGPRTDVGTDDSRNFAYIQADTGKFVTQYEANDVGHLTIVTDVGMSNGAQTDFTYFVMAVNPTRTAIYFNGVWSLWDIYDDDMSGQTMADYENSDNARSPGIGTMIDDGVATTYMLNGFIDEVHIMNEVQTVSWIHASYNTTSSPSTFLNVGDEQSAPEGWSNSNPVASSPNPPDTQTGVKKLLANYSSHFNISVTDKDNFNQSVNVTWRTNESGSWLDMGYNESVDMNLTFYCMNVSWVDTYDTTYWWSVNISDDHTTKGWDNETFSFTTENLSVYNTWWKYSGNPILVNSTRGEGHRDDYQLYKPVLLDWNATHWCVYYIANDDSHYPPGSGHNDTIFFASILKSNEPIFAPSANWTRHTNATGHVFPVVDCVGEATWEHSNVYLRTIVEEDTNDYRMWYLGDNYDGAHYLQVGYATSTDGTTWAKSSYNPVMNFAELGVGVQGTNSFAVCKNQTSGEYWAMYTAYTDLYNNVHLANSSDGINWTVQDTDFLDGCYPTHLLYDSQMAKYILVGNIDSNLDDIKVWTAEYINGTYTDQGIQLSAVDSGWEYRAYHASLYRANANKWYLFYNGYEANDLIQIGYAVINGSYPYEGWAPVVNNLPTQSGESPTNTSTNISITPTLYVICTDVDSDTMTARWYSNSSDAWVHFGTNGSISTGTNITQDNSNFSEHSTTYYWSVNLTDGTDWCNETYHFTTLADTVTITRISYSPTNIRVNDTSYVDILFNITTGNTLINQSSLLFAHTVNQTAAGYGLNFTYRILKDSVELRSDNRDEGYWYEQFNASGTGEIGYHGEWGAHDNTSVKFILVGYGSNWTTIRFNGATTLAPHMFSNIWYVDRTDMQDNASHIFDIYNNLAYKAKFNMTGTDFYNDPQYNNSLYQFYYNLNDTGSPNKPLKVYLANASYMSGKPAKSDYCVLIGEHLDEDVTDYSIRNSSYWGINFSTNATGYVGSLKMTEKFYFIFVGKAGDVSNKYDLAFCDSNNSGRDFNNSDFTEYSSDGGNNWAIQNGTIDCHLKFAKLDNTSRIDYKVYANDTSGNEAWSTVYTDLIDVVNVPPNPADILTQNGTITDYNIRDIINITYKWIGDPNQETCWVNTTCHDNSHAIVAYIENRSITHSEVEVNLTWWIDWDTDGVDAGSDYHINITITDPYGLATGSESNGTFNLAELIIDVDISPDTWLAGNVDVGTNIQENFTFWQNGSATIDIIIGINSTYFTYVNYASWLNLGHDRYCANFTTDNWATESSIEPGYPPSSVLKSSFSPGSFTFGVRIWMPRTVTYSNKQEDFKITLVISESS